MEMSTRSTYRFIRAIKSTHWLWEAVGKYLGAVMRGSMEETMRPVTKHIDQLLEEKDAEIEAAKSECMLVRKTLDVIRTILDGTSTASQRNIVEYRTVATSTETREIQVATRTSFAMASSRQVSSSQVMANIVSSGPETVSRAASSISGEAAVCTTTTLEIAASAQSNRVVSTQQPFQSIDVGAIADMKGIFQIHIGQNFGFVECDSAGRAEALQIFMVKRSYRTRLQTPKVTVRTPAKEQHGDSSDGNMPTNRPAQHDTSLGMFCAVRSAFESSFARTTKSKVRGPEFEGQSDHWGSCDWSQQTLTIHHHYHHDGAAWPTEEQGEDEDWFGALNDFGSFWQDGWYEPVEDEQNM